MTKNGAKRIGGIADLKPDSKNANRGTQRGRGLLEKSLRQYGAGRSVLADREGNLIAGNKTVDVAAEIDLPVRVVQTDGHELVVVQRTDLDIDSSEGRGLAIADNRTGETGLEWDTEALLDLSANGIVDLEDFWKPEELEELLGEWGDEPSADPGAQIDRADELRQKWGVESGQLWSLGDHRLICGDCTDAGVMARLMDGENAALVHADPPYGMGKENDGIANDNLYRDKLDAFQMEWWRAMRPHLADNASAYIWGNAEDLWRLWYVGGLRDSERVTFRNEIVWKKGSAGAGGISHMGAEALRLYPNETERCLFFMLGEQGFNNNADNYWEGWDSVVNYLRAERDKTGWSIAKFKQLAGHSETSGCHWFDKSQWMMPTRPVYEAWQQAAREHDAFKREHDDLKREFYATRAYFDNTHDNMTDVWHFERVKGEERHDHATPKPVEMMERAIKSSAPADALVLVPFNGTGPELIACERLGRKCRAVEIAPGYVGVALERWAQMTGGEPELHLHN